MMQKCSELGNNPEAWQQLFRFGKSRLKVKKGPNGHYLEHECRDELQKTLPAKAFESLMSSVATWMARLDEKDNKARRQREAAVKVPKKLPSEPPVEPQLPKDGDSNKLSAVVDLCSDGDERDSLGENLDSFDANAVLSQSSVIIIDDDLGEVNLKDFADHVEGKLDAQTLKKNNQKKQNNTKGSSIVKFLVPLKPNALQRPVKTYVIKRKPTVQQIGETLSDAMATSNDPKILREVNREASREGGQMSRKPDIQGPKVNREVTPDGDRTLVAAENSQQKLQIVTEPTAYYNLEAKPGVEDKVRQSELESKSNAEKKTEPEIRTNTKENESTNGFNLEQAERERTKEGALPEDTLRNQRLEQDNHAPQIRIRTDLGPHQRDVIRVRTDLLLEQPPEESPNQSPSAETLVPERTANKRKLSEAQNSQHPPKRPALYPQYSAPSTCPVSISSTPVSSTGYPASTTNYLGNPAPVRPPPVNPTPARPPPVNPAPPVVTVRYKLIAPRPPAPVISTSTSTSTATSSTYQRDVSISCQAKLNRTSSHNHNSVNSASTSSSGYPSGSHMCPVTSNSNHQPINPANRPTVTNGRHSLANPMPPPPAASSNYSIIIPGTADRSAPSPIIPMMNQYPPGGQYQPPKSMPVAPVGTSMCPPGAPGAPLPPSSYIQVPPVATAPVTAVNGGSIVDPRTDLATILDMLSQVELFAYRQENQEAFHLVAHLRNSLQRGAAFAYRR